MNIGFDLDGIFINTPPFVPKEIIEKLYKKKDNGVLLYKIPSIPEQIFRKATHLPIFRPPIEDNLKFLKGISKKDHKLYLISSRFKFLEKETKQLVRKYDLDKVFDGIYFNFDNKQPHVFKDEVIKKLKLDTHIDDDLSLLKFVAKHNPKTKFLWLNDKLGKEPISKNVFPIAELKEIFK